MMDESPMTPRRLGMVSQSSTWGFCRSLCCVMNRRITASTSKTRSKTAIPRITGIDGVSKNMASVHPRGNGYY